jgi:hypothetical protein
MNPIRSKHIVIVLVAAFILFLFYKKGDEDYSYDHTGAQSPVMYQPSYHSFESGQGYPPSSRWSTNPSKNSRHEVLQSKVKGYREETYWGSEHPTHEKVRQMDNDEFDHFIEEVELNDTDVYWGAEY